MITLAIGVAFFYLTQQNYSVFNGFQGFANIEAPTAVRGIDLGEPRAVLHTCRLAVQRWQAYFGVKLHGAARRSASALQGVRDNARRMGSLGYRCDRCTASWRPMRIAGLLAAVPVACFSSTTTARHLARQRSTPPRLINVLVIAVLGGMKHPIGAFIGALVFVLLQNFAIDLVDRERFNLVIGGVFLAIVLFSPDGLLGLWAKLRSRLAQPTSNQRRQP